jgi:hypothetical protein
MDKLAKLLREDAEKIECTVSDDLDERIRASLQGIEPEAPQHPKRESKSFSFWWASSLTGVAAAIAVIAVVNMQAPEPDPVTAATAPQPLVLPTIQWKAETAVFTSPLEEEIDNLQSDLKKAEEAVKQDIDRLF